MFMQFMLQSNKTPGMLLDQLLRVNATALSSEALPPLLKGGIAQWCAHWGCYCCRSSLDDGTVGPTGPGPCPVLAGAASGGAASASVASAAATTVASAAATTVAVAAAAPVAAASRISWYVSSYPLLPRILESWQHMRLVASFARILVATTQKHTCIPLHDIFPSVSRVPPPGPSSSIASAFSSGDERSPGGLR